MARHPFHCLQHSLIIDAAIAKLHPHHLMALIGVIARFGVNLPEHTELLMSETNHSVH